VDPDPDPTSHFDADPDPDPSFQIKAQNLEKKCSNRLIFHTLVCHLQIDADPEPDPAYHNDADSDPDPNPDPTGFGSATLVLTQSVAIILCFGWFCIRFRIKFLAVFGLESGSSVQ
jgi:hypothetical protein